MKLKRVFLFCGLFALLYGTVVLAVAPFLVSWGSEATFGKKFFDFLTSVPINWSYLMVHKSIAFVFVNGLFWAIILSLLYIGATRVFKRA